jgi:3-phosphoshikimate 1-carboxyvinyltransferase
MNEFGLRVPINRNYEEFYFPQINPLEKPKTGKPVTYTVEGDWSGAAFLLVAGAIAGPVAVKGLDTNSTQGDKAVIQALMSAGAGVSVERDSIEIRPARLRAFQFNATDCPDLFPPLVALAAYCQGTTVLEGVTRLTHKESDRAHTLQEEFGKLGVSIDLQDDLMVVHGGGGTKGGNTHSRHDHRIAMACAVAALAASADTTVEDAEAVDKSYPDFYEDLQRLGAQLEMFQFSS